MTLVTTDEIRARFNFGIWKKKFYEFREIYLFPDPVKIVKRTRYYDLDEVAQAIEQRVLRDGGRPTNEHGNSKIRDLQNIHYGHYSVKSVSPFLNRGSSGTDHSEE